MVYDVFILLIVKRKRKHCKATNRRSDIAQSGQMRIIAQPSIYFTYLRTRVSTLPKNGAVFYLQEIAKLNKILATFRFKEDITLHIFEQNDLREACVSFQVRKEKHLTE